MSFNFSSPTNNSRSARASRWDTRRTRGTVSSNTSDFSSVFRPEQKDLVKKEESVKPVHALACPVHSLWRRDPEESFSDWTIVVRSPSSSTCDNVEAVTSPELSTVRFHVHRNVLALGVHKSEYFAAQFRQEMKENQERTSHIELEPHELKVFELFLDYLYAPGPVNLVAVCDFGLLPVLHHLGVYFGVESLSKDLCKSDDKPADTFISHEELLEKMPTFIQHLVGYHDDAMLDYAAEIFAFQLFDLSGPDGNEDEMMKLFVPLADVDLVERAMKSIISQNEANTRSDRVKLIQMWLVNHKDECDSATCLKLTTEFYIPTLNISGVSSKAVIDLVELERELVGDTDELTDLQKTSIRLLVTQWQHLKTYSPKIKAPWKKFLAKSPKIYQTAVLCALMD